MPNNLFNISKERKKFRNLLTAIKSTEHEYFTDYWWIKPGFCRVGSKLGHCKKTKFEPGRATAQHVILLLPSSIDNISSVIFIGLRRRYLRLWHHIL